MTSVFLTPHAAVSRTSSLPSLRQINIYQSSSSVRAPRRRTEGTLSDVSIPGRHYLHKWPGVRDRGGLSEDSSRRQGEPLFRCRASSPLTDGRLIDRERPQKKKRRENWTDRIYSTRPRWKDLGENISILNETVENLECYWTESSVRHRHKKKKRLTLCHHQEKFSALLSVLHPTARWLPTQIKLKHLAARLLFFSPSVPLIVS